MTTKYDILRDKIIEAINTVSPEYVDQSEDCDYSISQLLDSVEEFDRECEDGTREEDERWHNFYRDNISILR